MTAADNAAAADYILLPMSQGLSLIHISVVKKANAAIDSNAADKETVVKVAVSAIDSAKSKGVIHKNTAARKISRMAKRANKAAAQ